MRRLNLATFKEKIGLNSGQQNNDLASSETNDTTPPSSIHRASVRFGSKQPPKRADIISDFPDECEELISPPQQETQPLTVVSPTIDSPPQALTSTTSFSDLRRQTIGDDDQSGPLSSSSTFRSNTILNVSILFYL